MTFPLIGKLQRTDHNNDDAEGDDDLVRALATDRAGIITTMMRRI